MVLRSGSNRHGRPAATLESKRTVTLRSEHVARRCFRNLRGAAIAGGAAEPVIERHGRKGRPDHAGDNAPHAKATKMSRRRAGERLGLRALICMHSRHSHRPDQNGRPLHERHDVEQHDQRAERDRNGDRARRGGRASAPRSARSRFPAACSSMRFAQRRHAAKRPNRPPSSCSVSSTANNRNR